MLVEKLEDYLDGSLSTGERAEVEAAVAKDPAAARRLAAVKGHRALRAAAIESYMPSQAESARLSDQLLAACHDEALAPVGRIGHSMRRFLTAAASVAIVSGVFMAGRATAPTQIVNVPAPTNTIYNVVYFENGLPMVKDFASNEERTKFIGDILMQGATGIAVNDLIDPGHM